MADEAGTLWSIGHSNLPVERFLALLAAHQIALVADVRTAPYSRHWPQFNREEDANPCGGIGASGYLCYNGRER